MSEQPPPQPRKNRKPRKPLNVQLIKSVIVLIVASLVALVSNIAGIGAQALFAPMLTWMFGYSVEKAHGTSLRYAIITAAAGYAGLSIVQGWSFGAVGESILLFFGATVGALAAIPLTPGPTRVGQKRLLHSIGVLFATFVIIQATHISALTRGSSHFAHWDSWWQLLLLGVAAGGMTQYMGLSGGVLLVPALYFLSGQTAQMAVIHSLLVVALAGLLPSWSYAEKGLADQTYLFPAIIGGLLGGMVGGALLHPLLERSILIVFGLIAMYLSARELYRLALAATPAPDIDPVS